LLRLRIPLFLQGCAENVFVVVPGPARRSDLGPHPQDLNLISVGTGAVALAPNTHGHYGIYSELLPMCTVAAAVAATASVVVELSRRLYPLCVVSFVLF
jgi:hypothetical protein